MSRSQTTLTELARLGFTELSGTADLLAEAGADGMLAHFALAADPDQALVLLGRLREHAPAELDALTADDAAAARLVQLLGASEGLGEFLLRRPAELSALATSMLKTPTASDYRDDLLASIDGLTGDDAWVALRVRYRRHLTRLASWDLGRSDPLAAVSTVAEALADLAGAALDASLAVARLEVKFAAADIERTRLAIIGMGKSGARELNYLSDVDVIFVAEPSGDLDANRAVEIGTRLAMLTMRGIYELAAEPELWEVDANLRPEGKDGALVRTLDSHLAYYDRWAKSWEFHALLKARPLAGDLELGEQYVGALAPKVWSSASRENFVESVQRMRERVTNNIPPAELDVQLKLGPGGLRDIEFTIQLLQLVHGQLDDEVHQRGTLPALIALADQGYIGRVEAAEFEAAANPPHADRPGVAAGTRPRHRARHDRCRDHRAVATH
jgi:glutamate-ammonia-ligase adenylyltransferase